MHLVNDQNHISGIGYFLEKPQHAGFKLATELRAGHQRRQIHQKDFFSLQLVRYIVFGNALGQRLCDRGLADAGLTDKTGIVFLPAAKNLDHAGKFAFPPDDPVQLSFCGAPSQIPAVGVKIFSLFLRSRFVRIFCGRRVLFLPGILFRFPQKTALPKNSRKVNGRCAAVLSVLSVAGQIGVGEQSAQFFLHIFQLFGRDAEFPHDIAHHLIGRKAEFTCALDAKSFGFPFAVFYLGHKNSCHPLVASGTHHHYLRFSFLHRVFLQLV